METLLHPAPRLGLRWPLFLALAALISIGHAAWSVKLVGIIWMAFLLGSYRTSAVDGEWFERRMVLMFVPLKRKRWQLSRFIYIETVWNDGVHIGWALLIGAELWIFSRLFDWIFPWIGGGYQLRLRHVKGGPVLAWQGNSESNFRANLEILQANTGLPVQRAGGST